MSKIHCVLFMLELTLPGKGVVVPLVLATHAVLVVADVVASADPASACFLCLCLGVDERPHAMIVERIRLNEVDDVEPVVLACFGVL